MKMTPSAERLQRVRIALLLDQPFFGTLMMNLKTIESKDVPTFCTDGKHLLYNPDFMEQLTNDELRTVLAHEVMHCAMLHPYRRGDRDLKKFNKAADYAINNFLDNINQADAKAGRAQSFPFTGKLKDALLDHQYDPFSAEEIYTRMPEPKTGQGGSSSSSSSSSNGGGQGPNGGKPQGQGGKGNGNGDSFGDFTDGASDQAEREQREADWKVALKQAALGAKAQGKLPAEAARLVDELLNPKVPWSEVLRTFLTAAAKDDYSWSRPNRRYSGGPVIMPGLHSPRMGTIIVAVDTSGSISPEDFNAFIAEVRGILFDCRPEKLILVQCDSQIADWRELEVFDEPATVDFKGGGGTDFRPVFDRAMDEVAAGNPPAALVYLTDLMGTFPAGDPGFPVLWAATTDRQAPFGITLSIK